MSNSGKTYEWRVLLGRVINDPRERERIAQAVGINNVTLTRWATNKSNPRIDGLHKLVLALPTSLRSHLTELIIKEFPEFSTVEHSAEEIAQEIPSAFYERVLESYISIPSLLRSSTIRVTILQQILGHLDPTAAGLAVSVSVCMSPSSENGMIRSLLEEVGRGTPPWDGHLRNSLGFLAIESPQGYAVTEGRTVVISSSNEKRTLYPDHVVEYEESAIACPILQADRVAGCLYLSSPLQNYFLPPLQEVVRNYTNLLTLSFEPQNFFKVGQLSLGVMPVRTTQQVHLRNIQQRITQRMRIISGDRPLTRIETEAKVLQEIEEELLEA